MIKETSSDRHRTFGRAENFDMKPPEQFNQTHRVSFVICWDFCRRLKKN